MEDTRWPKCVMFEEMVGGVGCVGGQEKEWAECFPDDLGAFGINADQWTSAAQDEGDGAERQNKGRDISWQNGSLQRKPRLDYGMQRYARTWREGPRRGKPKASELVLVCSPSLTSLKWRELISPGRLVCRCHDVSLWRYVCVCFASFSPLCFR